MEQVRHGQESWAQFDDDDDSSTVKKPLSIPTCAFYSYFPIDTSSFTNQEQTINSHLPNFGLTNQHLVFPSSSSNQSNELPIVKNHTDLTLSPVAATHHQSPRSRSIYHENLNSHSEINSSHCTEMLFPSHQLNNWSSFNQPTVQSREQLNTTDISPFANTATTTPPATTKTTTNFSPNLSMSNNYTVTNQHIGDPWAITSDQKAYYLSQFLRLQPDIGSKLSGIQSKTFFELSKLPSSELSKIWELSDFDHDGQLTLSEFCIAMHLVVYRLNGIPIPNKLPKVLLELIETNWLSTKSSFILSSTTIKTTTTTTTTATTATTNTTTTTTINATTTTTNSNCTLNLINQSNHYNNSLRYASIDVSNSCRHFDHNNNNNNHPHHDLSLFPSSTSSSITATSIYQMKTITTPSSIHINTFPIETSQTTNSTELKHHHHHHHHEQQQQQQLHQQLQRRWSISSQSDVSSLLASEEGMILFESKLSTNPQLKHPIPLRAGTLPSTIIPEMVNSMRTSSQDDYSTVDYHKNEFLHTYQFPYDNNNNNNAFCTTTHNPIIKSTPWLPPPLTTIHSSPILFNNSQHSDSMVSPSLLSVLSKAPPPPPPPRANLLLVTSIDDEDCVNNDHTGQKCDISSMNMKEELVPSVATKFNMTEMKLTESQQPLNNNNNDNDDCTNNVIDQLKIQCNSISEMNEQLTVTLIKLQKDRIALKIFLERLMPLKTI
ncbi:unnamed protein product [Schistosoma turkestanicum]|nr:unnamed protein product [Schistosoma turkestanicum]